MTLKLLKKMQLLAAGYCYFGCKSKLDYTVGITAISCSHNQIIVAELADYPYFLHVSF